MQIPPGAPTIVTQPQNVDIRSGESASLSVQATSPGGSLSYQWYMGQTGDVSHPVAGATSANCSLPGLNATTSVWVSVRNPFGTVDSQSATVTVFSAIAPKLRLQTLAGQPSIIIDGQVGTNCRIEFSADPARDGWSKLIDFSLPTAPFTYIDATGTSARLRFYRVVVP